jgi:hypothetical protein
LNKDYLSFDFNSKDDFSPDNDSVKVARKFWSWLLNPLPLHEFMDKVLKPGGKCLHISRSSGEAEVPAGGKDASSSDEEDKDSDSYGSEDEGQGFTYDQEEPMDNLIDSKMIKEYLNGKIGVSSATGDLTKIEYGNHLDLFTYLNEKEYSSVAAGTPYSQDYALDQLDSTNGSWLVLRRP